MLVVLAITIVHYFCVHFCLGISHRFHIGFKMVNRKQLGLKVNFVRVVLFMSLNS